MAVHDLVYQLRQGLDRFSPVERRIADAILADIPAAAQSGVGELAQRAGVSVAAVSRFAKALGCAHVRELRARLAEAGAVGRRFLDEAQAADALDAETYTVIPGFLNTKNGPGIVSGGLLGRGHRPER